MVEDVLIITNDSNCNQLALIDCTSSISSYATSNLKIQTFYVYHLHVKTLVLFCAQ